MLLLFPIIINAETWSSELPKENVNILDSEIRYKWYKEEKINENYCLLNECICEYFDYNDFIYTDYSELSETPFENKDPNKEYSTIVLGQTDKKKFKYIVFNNTISNFTNYITEVLIKDKESNQQLEYIVHGGCNIIPGEIDNSDFYKKALIINNDFKCTLELKEAYDVEQVKIHFYIYLIQDYNFSFKINYLNEAKVSLKNKVVNFTNATDMCVSDQYCFAYSIPDNNWESNSEVYKTYYRYREKMYKNYDINKIYLDDYYSNKEGYIKDSNYYKNFYKYELLKTESDEIEFNDINTTIKELENNKINTTNEISESEESTQNTPKELVEDSSTSVENSEMIGLINDQIAYKNYNEIFEKNNKFWLLFLEIFILINSIFGILFLIIKIKQKREKSRTN